MTRQPQAPESQQLLSGLPLWASGDQSQGQEPPLWPHRAQSTDAFSPPVWHPRLSDLAGARSRLKALRGLETGIVTSARWADGTGHSTLVSRLWTPRVRAPAEWVESPPWCLRCLRCLRSGVSEASGVGGYGQCPPPQVWSARARSLSARRQSPRADRAASQTRAPRPIPLPACWAAATGSVHGVARAALMV